MIGLASSTLPLAASPSRAALWTGVGALYAAAAVPLFFIYNILPASLRQAGQPPEIANLVFLAYLPFALRVLWAPLIDRLGRARAERYRWLALGMLALAIPGTGCLLGLSPASGALWLILGTTLLIVSVASSAIALDGYLLATLTPEERKRSAGFQGAGFALGGLVMGLGVMALDGASWRMIILLLTATTLAFVLPALLLPRSAAVASASETAGGGWRAAGRLLRRAPAWRRILFALSTHGGLGLAGGMLPVLQVDAGLSLGQIAALAAVGANGIGIVAAAGTGLALRKAAPWTVATAISLASALVFATLALAPFQADAMFAALASLAVMALGYGFFVTFRALVLPICGGAGGATQAAALASIDAFIATAAAVAAGWVLGSFGPSSLLLAAAALCAGGALVSLLAGGRAGEPDTTRL